MSQKHRRGGAGCGGQCRFQKGDYDIDFGKFLFNSLQIGVHGKYKDRPRFPDGELTPELYNYIKNALDTETFTHLIVHYFISVTTNMIYLRS